MTVYGYARVSTGKQDLERQLRNIRRAAPDAVIFQEAFTGKKVIGRREFNRLLRVVKPGDVIIFDDPSRMSRDAEQGYSIYMDLFEKGVNLQFINAPAINTDVYRDALQQDFPVPEVGAAGSSSDKLVHTIMEAITQFFRDLARDQIRLEFQKAQEDNEQRSRRIREGMQTAKEHGRTAGRRPGEYGSYNSKKYDALKGDLRRLSRDFSGTNTDAEVMEILRGKGGISRNTYYKYKKQLAEELQREECDG